MNIISILICVALIGCSSSIVKAPVQPVASSTTPETGGAAAPAKTSTSVSAETKSEQPKTEPSRSTMTCKLEKDERVVETVATQEGCELRYTKFDEAHVIASSTSGTSNCDRVRGQIKTNLEKAGFKCE